jgi:crotonobetainyl-CoA:carnitine CoA-transferase CaiB-like acyl-CoA transferase
VLLDGMKVVSFCHYLQGPAAMQYLADMGADVVKIEPPKGAFERNWSGADRASVGGVPALYLCANRNVRSIAIDLKRPEAREIAFRLIESSHAVTENFRPGALDRLGFGYEAVRARKPDIIYGSASGFGATGPYAERPGQDLLLQAMSGLATIGGCGDDPRPIGCAAVDQHGAALFAMALSAAYARLLKTGEGTRIEATLLGAAVDLQNESIATYFASGLGYKAFERNSHLATWYHPAPYGTYRIRDGHIAFSLNEIANIAAALDSSRLQALASRNAYRQRDAIVCVIADEIADRSFTELAAAFDAKGVWYARVEDYDDLRENPQVRHNGTLREETVNGEAATLVGHPLRYNGKSPEHCYFALTAGADTRAVLAEAGFSEAEIGAFIGEKLVFAAEQG